MAENEDILVIKELYKNLKPKYDNYINTHPASDKGREPAFRSMLIQHMKGAEDNLHKLEKAKTKKEIEMYSHTALS